MSSSIISRGSLGFEEFVPCFEDLLSLPPGDQAYNLLDPQMRRSRTFAAVIALLSAACREQTLVLVIEDLQWVEPSTEDFLAGFRSRLERYDRRHVLAQHLVRNA